jgi:hypothetical protein
MLQENKQKAQLFVCPYSNMSTEQGYSKAGDKKRPNSGETYIVVRLMVVSFEIPKRTTFAISASQI